MAPVAIVTGAARGAGAAAAARLAAQGMDIAALDAGEEACAATVDRIAAPGRRCLAVDADVTDAGSVDAAVARVCAELGDPSMLVYTAGGTVSGSWCGMSDREWYAAVTAPLRGAFVTSRAVLDPMAKLGAGRIVVLVAGSGNRTVLAALAGFTRTLALELDPLRITVNLVEGHYQDEGCGVPPGNLRSCPCQATTTTSARS